jgi:hypothetical protein
MKNKENFYIDEKNGFKIDFDTFTIKTNRRLDCYFYTDIIDLWYSKYYMFPFPLYYNDDLIIRLKSDWTLEKSLI